jgi:hypothetical protein
MPSENVFTFPCTCPSIIWPKEIYELVDGVQVLISRKHHESCVQNNKPGIPGNVLLDETRLENG